MQQTCLVGGGECWLFCISKVVTLTERDLVSQKTSESREQVRGQERMLWFKRANSLERKTQEKAESRNSHWIWAGIIEHGVYSKIHS